MSFSSNAKAELCRAPISRRCCALAEAYGVVLYCNTFRPDQLRIVTENPEFSARLPRLFKRAFGLEFDRKTVAGPLRVGFSWSERNHFGGYFSFGYDF